MGFLLMAGVGALFAGVVLGIRDLVPYMTARRSGVIARPGARDVRIRRDEDPDRFERLLASRSRSAATGFGLSMAGALVLSLFWLTLVGGTGPSAILIVVLYSCFALFAAFCLVRGFATGRMFAFWGLALFGEATLKQNPIWFWTYGTLNLVIVLVGASTVLQAFGR
jgi:hypothetical protein